MFRTVAALSFVAQSRDDDEVGSGATRELGLRSSVSGGRFTSWRACYQACQLRGVFGMVDESCEEHAWASVGVTVIDGEPSRVWVCEVCRAWSREVLDREDEVPWGSTVLGEE